MKERENQLRQELKERDIFLDRELRKRDWFFDEMIRQKLRMEEGIGTKRDIMKGSDKSQRCGLLARDTHT